MLGAVGQFRRLEVMEEEIVGAYKYGGGWALPKFKELVGYFGVDAR
jgi:hypothetical protein